MFDDYETIKSLGLILIITGIPTTGVRLGIRLPSVISLNFHSSQYYFKRYYDYDSLHWNLLQW